MDSLQGQPQPSSNTPEGAQQKKQKILDFCTEKGIKVVESKLSDFKISPDLPLDTIESIYNDYLVFLNELTEEEINLLKKEDGGLVLGNLECLEQEKRNLKIKSSSENDLDFSDPTPVRINTEAVVSPAQPSEPQTQENSSESIDQRLERKKLEILTSTKIKVKLSTDKYQITSEFSLKEKEEIYDAYLAFLDQLSEEDIVLWGKKEFCLGNLILLNQYKEDLKYLREHKNDLNGKLIKVGDFTINFPKHPENEKEFVELKNFVENLDEETKQILGKLEVWVEGEDGKYGAYYQSNEQGEYHFKIKFPIKEWRYDLEYFVKERKKTQEEKQKLLRFCSEKRINIQIDKNSIEDIRKSYNTYPNTEYARYQNHFLFLCGLNEAQIAYFVQNGFKLGNPEVLEEQKIAVSHLKDGEEGTSSTEVPTEKSADEENPRLSEGSEDVELKGEVEIRGLKVEFSSSNEGFCKEVKDYINYLEQEKIDYLKTVLSVIKVRGGWRLQHSFTQSIDNTNLFDLCLSSSSVNESFADFIQREVLSKMPQKTPESTSLPPTPQPVNEETSQSAPAPTLKMEKKSESPKTLEEMGRQELLEEMEKLIGRSGGLSNGLADGSISENSILKKDEIVKEIGEKIDDDEVLRDMIFYGRDKGKLICLELIGEPDFSESDQGRGPFIWMRYGNLYFGDTLDKLLAFLGENNTRLKRTRRSYVNSLVQKSGGGSWKTAGIKRKTNEDLKREEKNKEAYEKARTEALEKRKTELEDQGKLEAEVAVALVDEFLEPENKAYLDALREAGRNREGQKESVLRKATSWYFGLSKTKKIAINLGIAGVAVSGLSIAGIVGTGTAMAYMGRRTIGTLTGAGVGSAAGHLSEKVSFLSIDKVNKEEESKINELKNRTGLSPEELIKEYEKIKQEYDKKRKAVMFKKTIAIAGATMAGGMSGNLLASNLMAEAMPVGGGGREVAIEQKAGATKGVTETGVKSGTPPTRTSGVDSNSPKNLAEAQKQLDAAKEVVKKAQQNMESSNESSAQDNFEGLTKANAEVARLEKIITNQLKQTTGDTTSVSEPTKSATAPASAIESPKPDSAKASGTEPSTPPKAEPTKPTPEPAKSNPSKPSTSPSPKPEAEPAKPSVPKVETEFTNTEALKHTVKSGDSIWKLLEKSLRENQDVKEIIDSQGGQAKLTRMIDHYADEVLKDPGNFGVSKSGLKVGDKVDFAELFKNKDDFSKILSDAKGLSQNQIDNINANNEAIAQGKIDYEGNTVEPKITPKPFDPNSIPTRPKVSNPLLFKEETVFDDASGNFVSADPAIDDINTGIGNQNANYAYQPQNLKSTWFNEPVPQKMSSQIPEPASVPKPLTATADQAPKSTSVVPESDPVRIQMIADGYKNLDRNIDDIYGKKGLFGGIKSGTGISSEKWNFIGKLNAKDYVDYLVSRGNNTKLNGQIIDVIQNTKEHTKFGNNFGGLLEQAERLNNGSSIRPFENGETVAEFTKRLVKFMAEKSPIPTKR